MRTGERRDEAGKLGRWRRRRMPPFLAGVAVMVSCNRDPWHGESIAEQAEREHKAMVARKAADDARKAEQAAKEKAEGEKAGTEAQERREAAAAEASRVRGSEVQTFREMTPDMRRSALTDECRLRPCDANKVSIILDAAQDDAERATLQKIVDRELPGARARAKQKAATAAIATRQDFADDYDRELLAKHLNPDSVAATGAERTTLTVRGWFCSRQFVHDVATAGVGSSAAAVGFKKVECTSALESAWEELGAK